MGSHHITTTNQEILSANESLRIQWFWKNKTDDLYHHASAYLNEELKSRTGYSVLFSEEYDIPTEKFKEIEKKVREVLDRKIEDFDPDDLRKYLSGTTRYSEVEGRKALPDGGDNDTPLDDLEEKIREDGDKTVRMHKVIPRELGESILKGTVSRVRALWTSCEYFSGSIDRCWGFDKKYIRQSPDLGHGRKVYNGPIHAYTPLKEFWERLLNINFDRRSHLHGSEARN